MKSPKIRLDVKIVQDGLAQDAAEARGLIMAGKVMVGEQRVDKPGFFVKENEEIRVKGRRRFVSRGGEKLWGAIEDLDLEPVFKDAVVLDCGASTGGFSDCALQLGARRVHALEAGFNQLAWSLRTDPRVLSQEGCDIRLLNSVVDPDIRVVVADLSFISLNRMLPYILRIVPKHGLDFILLCKPQFELDVGDIPEGGVVDDPVLRDEAIKRVAGALERDGLQLQKSVPSRVHGHDGNQEVFVYARFHERDCLDSSG